MGAGDHVGSRRSGLRALHADAELRHHDRDAWATSLLVGFHLGPIFAIAQTVAKPNMRALAAATVLLTATCFGQGIGPLVVGGLNDAWKSQYGVEAVRYSMLSCSIATMLGALLFIWAAQSIRADIARARTS